MVETLMVAFYLLGGWMFICWTVDNSPPKNIYLCWSIPLWPLPALLLLIFIIKCALEKHYEKLRNPQRDGDR